MSSSTYSAPASSLDQASVSGSVSFTNSYARLPERFYSRLDPTPVASPRLVKLNRPLAIQLGIVPDWLASAEGVEVLAGNRVASGSEPLAQAYAGHQFGYFVPQLGDGRANLLGEVIGLDSRRYDLQLKGSGPTPFSRAGDGRAALGPVLREYLVSEAMSALGVPTTRALAAVTTGEPVFRETMLPGAILTRVAASHLRVGTFQYFAARNDVEATRILADYAIARHYPQAAQSKNPYRALLDGVITRQASLVANWMLVGFVHGVMNTDNMSISGETIDCGPCAFLEAYEPGKVFSSIDRQGRYAYGNQSRAALWNLARFAETLLPLLAGSQADEETALASAREAIAAFEAQFNAVRAVGLLRKVGLSGGGREEDLVLAEELLTRMAANQADFTLTFRRLCAAAGRPEEDAQVRALFADPAAYDSWAVQWLQRLQQEETDGEERAAAMRLVNPAFIPRNHLVQAMIEAAVEREDFQPFEEMLDVVSHPYEHRPEFARYEAPALPGQCVNQTFCGT